MSENGATLEEEVLLTGERSEDPKNLEEVSGRKDKAIEHESSTIRNNFAKFVPTELHKCDLMFILRREQRGVRMKG